MLRRLRKGQSTAEYAIVIGLVIAAAVAMQVYVKRGIQAKIKGAVDFNPDAAGKGSTKFTTSQYEPYYNSSTVDTARNAAQDIITENDGKVTRNIIDGEVTTSNGTQSILMPGAKDK